MIRGVLQPTVTHPHREYALLPVCGHLADYLLWIRQTTTSGREAEGVYLVQLDPAWPGEGSGFLILSPEGELYRVVVFSAFRGWCSCYAGQTHKTCKHRDALSDAVQQEESLYVG